MKKSVAFIGFYSIIIRRVFILFCIFVISVFTAFQSWAGGDLDAGFGQNGKVVTYIGEVEDVGMSVAIQPDGKIVVGGYSKIKDKGRAFAVARFTPDGKLDPAFGKDGKTLTSIGKASQGHSVGIQPDGKIVVGGQAEIDLNYDFAAARYNPDGSLDTSFGQDGTVSTPIGPGEDNGYSMTLQSDGKILMAGISRIDGKDHLAVIRYNSDGGLDTSFGREGKVTTAVGKSIYIPVEVRVQSDGKIVVVGGAEKDKYRDFFVVRYNPDGSLDASFGQNGILFTPIGPRGDDAATLILQPDGKIVPVGSTYDGSTDHFALVRYNSDGSLDASFGKAGKVVTPMDKRGDRGQTNSAALQPDGKIVITGVTFNGKNRDIVVVRYNPDGSLDTAFGQGGIAVTAIGQRESAATATGQGDDYGNAVTVQPDGKIIVAGSSQTGDRTGFVVIRYLSK